MTLAELERQRELLLKTEARLVAKLDEEEQWAIRADFPPAQPFYALGWPLAEVGKRNYRESRKSFDEMGFLSQEAQSLLERVASEERQDVVIPLPRAHMDNDGCICWNGSKLAVEEDAFKQLATVVGMYRAGGYLATCPPKLRATNINEWLDILKPQNEIVARVRQNAKTGDAAFAFVSQGYAALDVDDVAMVMAQVLPQHTRGVVRYDGVRASITALFHAPQSMDCRVGSNYKAAIRAKTGDTGRDALELAAMLYQALCINLTTAERAQKVERAIHRGTTEQLLQKLLQAISKSASKVEPFVNRWLEAEKDETLKSIRHGDVEPVIAAMVAKRLVPKQPHVSDDEMVRRIRGCYWKAPDPTVTGIVSAITRAAHEKPWASPWSSEELEDAAGELVQNYVRVVKLVPSSVKKAEEFGWKPRQFTLAEVEDGTVDRMQVVRLTLD